MDQTSSDNRTDQPFTIRKAETNEDLQEIAALADVIWHEHFTPIIGKEQVEYMLSRFSLIRLYKIRFLPDTNTTGFSATENCADIWRSGRIRTEGCF